MNSDHSSDQKGRLFCRCSKLDPGHPGPRERTQGMHYKADEYMTLQPRYLLNYMCRLIPSQAATDRQSYDENMATEHRLLSRTKC